MANKSHHVVPGPEGGWNVKKGGSERASKHFELKKDAITFARKLSINQKSDLVIHNRDGTVQSKDSYGNDPFPLKGKK